MIDIAIVASLVSKKQSKSFQLCYQRLALAGLRLFKLRYSPGGYPDKQDFADLWSWRYVPLSESILLLISKIGLYFLVERSRLMTPVLEVDINEGVTEEFRES